MKTDITILTGDNRVVMQTLAAGSFHAVVTDPPYELGFMGKAWDSSGIAYDAAVWAEVFRVLKPGGWVLAFGGSRTYHRLACAIEDAGFEVRDMIEWIYGSGFPKSLDVSKGACRTGNHAAAKQWAGWGTALKPAHEPVCVARKPLAGTVAENVLQHGCGALNIDASRVGGETITTQCGDKFPKLYGKFATCKESQHVGRWPANLILDGVAAAMLDAQSGERCGGGFPQRRASQKTNGIYEAGWQQDCPPGPRDMGSGGASRFFYTAKASGSDRGNLVKGELPLFGVEEEEFRNTHPTVKPVALMEYLLKLVCPVRADGQHIQGGACRVLDPFAGSGSTLVAAQRLGIDCTGIELLPEHVAIIEERVRAARAMGKTGN